VGARVYRRMSYRSLASSVNRDRFVCLVAPACTAPPLENCTFAMGDLLEAELATKQAQNEGE
jgi:hypothetical protein